MNAHDSERIKGMLEELGLGEAPTQAEADVVVFNTCTIREKPDTKFAAYIGDAIAQKRRRPDTVIAVGGCYAEAQRERLFMAGNQLGKTLAGGFECAMHMTGRYPDWWPGLRFDRPVAGWVAGRTGEDLRGGMQRILLGRPGRIGTGAIPKALRCTPNPPAPSHSPRCGIEPGPNATSTSG